MGIEQVIQRVQSDKRQRDAARDNARAAFVALSKADRVEVLAEFVALVMTDEDSASEPAAPQPPATKVPARTGKVKQTKTDQAEELVRTRPGITTKEIATHIKQSPRTAGSTLHQLATKRGSIKSRNGGWYPVASKAPSKSAEGGGTVRDWIIQVMSDGVSRGTRDIIKAIQALHPDANKNSINAGVYRMATMDPPMLIRRTVDGGLVYALVSTDTKIQDAKVAPAA